MIYSADQIAEREDLFNYIWDAYRDVHGPRPRWMNFNNMTMQEMREVAARLEVDVKESIREDEIQLEKDLAAYEKMIQATILNGAGDRITALRWILASELYLDLDQWMYEQGIRFASISQRQAIMQELEEAMAQMRD